MDKDLIKVLIAEYQQKAASVDFQKRTYLLEDPLNYVFVGLRRAGKSYMMFQQIRHLLEMGHEKEEILYFNFEDDRIASLDTNDLDLIKVCYEEMYDCKPIFCLDEIQIVEHWEKFARRRYSTSGLYYRKQCKNVEQRNRHHLGRTLYDSEDISLFLYGIPYFSRYRNV